MNLRPFLTALALGVSAAADTPSAESFLRVPDAVWSWKDQEQTFDAADLPEELRELARAVLRPDGPPPAQYSGFSLDLNEDKSPEYFIRSSLGGSGGPHYFIYAKRDGEWQNIGDFQGGFHLLKPQDGWNTIIGFSRGGGDSFAMVRFDFRGSRYEEIWTAHFDAGQIIPPQTLYSYRAWCDDARSAEERLERLEGFWQEFLPGCDGGSNPDRPDYEDAPHISLVRGTAYDLALAYTAAGRKDAARKIIEWLRWSDQLELWSNLPNPLTRPGQTPSGQPAGSTGE